MNTGGESTWSSVWAFTTIPQIPGVPTLTAPANNATDVALNTSLTWNAVTEATSYHVEVSSVSDFSITLMNTTVASTSSTFSNELSNNTKYYWRISAVNDGGESSWSTVWNFTTTVSIYIDNVQGSDGFFIFPNPTTGIINIKFGFPVDEETILWIYNNMGQVVKNYTLRLKIDQTITLNINNLPSGTYLIKLKSKGTFKNKIIILK